MPSASRRVFAVLAWRLTAAGVAGTLLFGLSFAPPEARAIVQPESKLTAAGPWLDRFNAWRAATDVPALTENTTWSSGDYSHALYMVKNNLVTHYETAGTPYYTAAGDAAARNGNIYVSSSSSTTDVQAIDWWMQAPFHALGMMDPRLTATGFGSYRESGTSWNMGAAVDVLRGNSFSGGHYPVYFPGNGSTEPLTSYGGNESPNPLAACSGYTAPSGLPVFVQVGGNLATAAGPVHSFTGNGVALEHCVIDSSNTSVGSSLKSRGAVILIPRAPLRSGVKYVVALTVNGAPYTWTFTVGALAAAVKTPCTAVSATTSPAASVPAGSSVTITASSVGCPNPRYRFWVQAPGGPWVIKQDYSSSDTYTWPSPQTMGTYRLEVDARDAPESVAYDVVTNFDYVLSGCSAVALAASPASPQYPAGAVTFTATPTCVGTPTYRFWVRPPGGGWSMRQDYSTANSFSWPIAGLAPGAYGIEVDERSQGSTESYQKVSNLSYVLAITPCLTASLAVIPASPGATGSTVNITASSTGCVNPRYRFWIRTPDGRWSIVKDYSAANVFAWTGTGRVGAHSIEVDVRDALESATYDAVSNSTYVVAGCSAAALTATPPGSAPRGTAISLSATATCLGTPTYKFWIKGPGGSWTVVQQYSTTQTYAWNPSAPGTYYIEIDVRNQGGTDTYEKVSNLTFVVT